MKILYGEEKKGTDEYQYRINQGGDLNIKVSNASDRHVFITFVDGKLSSVTHNMSDHDERSKWYVYGAIAEQIKEIEARYAERKIDTAAKKIFATNNDA